MKFSNSTEEEWVGKLSSDIKTFLEKQSKLITADISKKLKKLGKADDSSDNTTDANSIIDGYVSETWKTDLTAILVTSLYSINKEAMTNTVDTLPETATISGDFTKDEYLHQKATDYSEKRTAELVTNLDESTRNMLRSDLVTLMEAGLSPREIAEQLQGDYAFSEIRSNCIARTETGFAWNHGTISMYQGVDGGTGVLVFDGDHDKACEESNGQAWSFDYALEHLLQHPNCVRSFSLHFDQLDIE